jgi:hypothetical protein
MAFIDINTKVSIVLTKYGKQKLLENGNINFKYFSFSDNGVNYNLMDETEKVTDTNGDTNVTLYNSTLSSIIYKK